MSLRLIELSSLTTGKEEAASMGLMFLETPHSASLTTGKEDQAVVSLTTGEEARMNDLIVNPFSNLVVGPLSISLTRGEEG